PSSLAGALPIGHRPGRGPIHHAQEGSPASSILTLSPLANPGPAPSGTSANHRSSGPSTSTWKRLYAPKYSMPTIVPDLIGLSPASSLAAVRSSTLSGRMTARPFDPGSGTGSSGSRRSNSPPSHFAGTSPSVPGPTAVTGSMFACPTNRATKAVAGSR